MGSTIGWLMIVVSGAVLFAAFPGKYGSRALLPEFIGTFGLPFALAFAAVQYAVAARLRRAKVLWLVTVLFVIGAILGTVGRAIDLRGFCAEHNISYAEYVLCGGACASGLGLGIAMVRGWIYED
jgi:hypothetical protein